MVLEASLLERTDPTSLVGSYWCEVKQGTTYLEDQRQNMGSSGGLFAVKSFWMAKYPITNSDYQQFIDANDGFRNKTWWDFSPFARLYHLENQSPTKSLSKEAISPKTNISWYDAIAFCRWLSCHIGTQVTLPTEQQWQLAAMGDTTREYPWSDKYHINDHIYEAYFTKPIPVTHHPELVSPFGVYGMVSSVWEWTLSDWQNGQTKLVKVNTHRVIRGGRLIGRRRVATNTLRYKNKPENGGSFQGFRVCIS